MTTHPELMTLVDTATVADLSARADEISAALATVRDQHPGYRFTHANEIRCTARACSEFLDVRPGVAGDADAAYAGHISHELDLLLAARDAQ